MIGELQRQMPVGDIVFGDDHHASRILVQPMHDPWTANAPDAGKAAAAMMDQCIDQRAGPIAGGGMNDQPGGLGDDDDIVVLVEHVQRNILAQRRRVFRLGQGDLVDIAGANLALGVGHRRAVEPNGAVLDQRLHAAAGKFLADLGRQP